MGRELYGNLTASPKVTDIKWTKWTNGGHKNIAMDNAKNQKCAKMNKLFHRYYSIGQ